MGFTVLALVTLGITIFTVVQAVAGKQDIKTNKKAGEIAKQLNLYITNNRQIPASLEAAGINDVPDTIKYTKTSEQDYRFCVTYKASRDYGGIDVTSVLWGSALRDSSYSDDDMYDLSGSSYTPSNLYINYTYKKGENCQTIKPIINNYNRQYNYPSSSSTSNSTNGAARDTERKTDINTIHAQLEAYYAENERYPTLDNLNNKTFRTSNLKGLSDTALMDSSSSTSYLYSSPYKNYYSYRVSASGGLSCNNTSNDCVKYVLTAVLEDSSYYTKNSLN